MGLLLSEPDAILVPVEQAARCESMKSSACSQHPHSYDDSTMNKKEIGDDNNCSTSGGGNDDTFSSRTHNNSSIKQACDEVKKDMGGGGDDMALRHAALEDEVKQRVGRLTKYYSLDSGTSGLYIARVMKNKTNIL
mmetsp:Transcript_8101/g.13607  ORF Transcript_8101/g.13607 Transcript_8101/m.13607 type:complete len:136 (-) Transcript_8101:86-493(-)